MDQLSAEAKYALENGSDHLNYDLNASPTTPPPPPPLPPDQYWLSGAPHEYADFGEPAGQPAGMHGDPLAGAIAAPPSSGKRKRSAGTARAMVRACVYCRKSKMSCDGQRPCQRCIDRSIAAMCKDPVPKRRGRHHSFVPEPEAPTAPRPPPAPRTSAASPAPRPAPAPAPPKATRLPLPPPPPPLPHSWLLEEDEAEVALPNAHVLGREALLLLPAERVSAWLEGSQPLTDPLVAAVGQLFDWLAFNGKAGEVAHLREQMTTHWSAPAPPSSAVLQGAAVGEAGELARWRDFYRRVDLPALAWDRSGRLLFVNEPLVQHANLPHTLLTAGTLPTAELALVKLLHPESVVHYLQALLALVLDQDQTYAMFHAMFKDPRNTAGGASSSSSATLAFAASAASWLGLIEGTLCFTARRDPHGLPHLFLGTFLPTVRASHPHQHPPRHPPARGPPL